LGCREESFGGAGKDNLEVLGRISWRCRVGSIGCAGKDYFHN
jgi:hypothetical protein